MANKSGKQVVNQSQRAYTWLAVLVALVLVVAAAWAQPVGAGSGVSVTGSPAPLVPSNPIKTISLGAYNLPLSQVNGQAAQAPLPQLGGTCISGYLIDSYHARLGAGWEITLSAQDGPSMTTTSNEDGEFQFSELPAGTFMVELKMVDGWRPFTPTQFPVTLNGAGDDCAVVRFKLEALPCLQVVKLDGGQDEEDDPVGIPEWNFTATQGNTKLSTITDGQGIAFFYNLTPGTWVVTEEEKTGWRPADGYSRTQEIDLFPPEQPGSCHVLHFVNEQIHDACVIVQKTDIAGDPVEGWQVAISRNDGTQPPQDAETDETGQVIFDGLALGKWTVMEETREWWRPLGETSVGVTLERPGYCQVVKFVNEPLGCVDGYKINHLEEGLPGWQINAVNQDTGQEFSTITDENGYFYFNTLSLGTWILSEELQPGWEPVTAPKFPVQVTEPFQCETVRFKNRTEYACLDVFKRDQVDGVGLPGWKITLQPAYGGEAATAITDGSGWARFNELVPGTYIVKEEVLPGWTAATPEELEIELTASGTCGVVNFCNIQTHMIEDDPPVKPKDKPTYGQCPLYYTVKPGNTVWGIGQYFGVPSSAIARVNHLKNPALIYPGQRLCIPLGDP